MPVSWPKLRRGAARIILAGITLGTSSCGWTQFGMRSKQPQPPAQDRAARAAEIEPSQSAALLEAETAAARIGANGLAPPGDRQRAPFQPAAAVARQDAALQPGPDQTGQNQLSQNVARQNAHQGAPVETGLLDAESQRIDLVSWLRQNEGNEGDARQPPVQGAPEMYPRLGGPGMEPISARMEEINAGELTGLLGERFTAVDLASSLNLAGVQNPELLLARQRVVYAVAERQLAAAEILPSLRLGLSFDSHTGPLQQSFGNILRVTRNNLFVGAGAYTIAAGTVNIPGVYWSDNVSDAIFRYLATRQVVEQHQFESRAVENEVMRRVAIGYTDLLRAVGNRAIAYENVRDAADVVRLTEAFARAGAGREADADRARSELATFTSLLREMEGEMLISSADLAELLNLDPSTRLVPLEERYVPLPFVPDPIPLPELITIALVQRPELQERQANIQKSLLQLRSARILPFSPNMIIGFSGGGQGGGSNIVAQPAGTTPFATAAANENGTGRFGNSGQRYDFDVVGYWMLKNLGVGNRAQIREAESHLRTSELEWLLQLDYVRMSVAQAYARTHANFAQIQTAEQGVRDALVAFEEDKRRIMGFAGLPIELLDSLRLIAEARREYFQAIVAYNQAQFDLYVALGQPPVAMLARPAAEGELLPPTGERGTRLPPVPEAMPPAAENDN